MTVNFEICVENLFKHLINPENVKCVKINNIFSIKINPGIYSQIILKFTKFTSSRAFTVHQFFQSSGFV